MVNSKNDNLPKMSQYILTSFCSGWLFDNFMDKLTFWQITLPINFLGGWPFGSWPFLPVSKKKMFFVCFCYLCESSVWGKPRVTVDNLTIASCITNIWVHQWLKQPLNIFFILQRFYIWRQSSHFSGNFTTSLSGIYTDDFEWRYFDEKCSLDSNVFTWNWWFRK